MDVIVSFFAFLSSLHYTEATSLNPTRLNQFRENTNGPTTGFYYKYSFALSYMLLYIHLSLEQNVSFVQNSYFALHLKLPSSCILKMHLMIKFKKNRYIHYWHPMLRVRAGKNIDLCIKKIKLSGISLSSVNFSEPSVANSF